MSFRRIYGLEDLMDSAEQQEDTRKGKEDLLKFSEILDASKEYSAAYHLLATTLVSKGIMSKKQFFISFMRNISTLHFKRNPSVMKKIQCSTEDIDLLVSSLFDALNSRFSELGFRLYSVTDEEHGREMVVLVTEDIPPKELRALSGFNEDELALFARYVQQIVKCDGECELSWALQEGSRHSNSLSLMKTQIFIEKLISSDWIIEKDGDLRLAPRAIAELEPVLAWQYGCPNCALCQKVVICKFAAVTCEECRVYMHKNCLTRLSVGCAAAKILCPGGSINGCTAMFSRSAVEEQFS